MIDLPFVSVGELPPYEINKLPAVVRVPLHARMERALERVSVAYRNRFQTAPRAQGGNMNQTGNSNAALSRMAGDANATREPQISSSINRLQNALERLHHAADRLEQRASVALRPSAPAPGNPGGRIEKVAELKAPLAQAIDALTDRVDGACEHIVGVTDRLEV